MRRFLVAIMAIPAALWLISVPAAASCAQAPPLKKAIAQAESLFVGQVTVVSNGDRTAEVRVREVWKGHDIPELLTIVGGPEGSSIGSSVDRTYQVGATYLFFPYRGEDGGWRDNSCTSTQKMTPQLARFRPPEVVPPEPHGEGLGPDAAAPPVYVWAGAALLLALGISGLVIKKRA